LSVMPDTAWRFTPESRRPECLRSIRTFHNLRPSV